MGIVAGIHETGQHDERHLVAMWVADDRRGTFVAAELVEAICGWTRLQRLLGHRLAQGLLQRQLVADVLDEGWAEHLDAITAVTFGVLQPRLAGRSNSGQFTFSW